MTIRLTTKEREAFAALANVLIPSAHGMPAAPEVGIQDEALDHVLSLRPELANDLVRGIRALGEGNAAAIAETLSRDDPAALGAIGLVAAAAYYMNTDVRQRLGYRGQESRPATDDEEHDYLRDDLLQPVIDRGPIFRPTPK